MASARTSALKVAAVALCVVLVLSSMGRTAMSDCATDCADVCSCTGTCRGCIREAACARICGPASTVPENCPGCLETARLACEEQCVTGCDFP
ncbi:hypothetical protein CFC21_096475 [Triticum aestivum]|uniref:Uncharacterized protein n=2 Tax=Triticum aestivum TaxID=4565 RepID=A0A3B6REJ0_WHEAT|nr:hypothetical protein CFC21_096475 [Triticum aestivum]